MDPSSHPLIIKSGLLNPGPEVRSCLLSDETIETNFHVELQPFARGKFATVRRAWRKDEQKCGGRGSSSFAAKYIRKRRRVSIEEVWHEVCVLNLSRDCPFIVHLFQVFDTPLDTILMLEMAEGGDLQTVLDTDEYLEESLVVNILRDTLKGLLFLHGHSIAHLDVKPANLVLTGPLPIGHVKLCDFGLSRHITIGTEVRELAGTPEYVSPEVINYDPITLAVDCWSVGVLAYVLLSGLSPFGADSKQETYLNISRCLLQWPEDYFGTVSPIGIDWIEKCLVVRPSERLTIEESLSHLWFLNEEPQPSSCAHAILDSTTTKSSTSSTSSPSSPPVTVTVTALTNGVFV